MNAPFHWLTALLITLALGWLAARDSYPLHDEAMAAVQDIQAQHSRDWAAQQVCGLQPYEWVDDKTLVCHREAVTTTAQVLP